MTSFSDCLSRRRFIATSTVSTLIAVTGCIGSTEENDTDPTEESTKSGNRESATSTGKTFVRAVANGDRDRIDELLHEDGITREEISVLSHTPADLPEIESLDGERIKEANAESAADTFFNNTEVNAVRVDQVITAIHEAKQSAVVRITVDLPEEDGRGLNVPESGYVYALVRNENWLIATPL